MEGVWHLLMREHELHDVHEAAVRKTEQDGVRHRVLQTAASIGFCVERDIPPQALGRRPAKCSAWANALGTPGDCVWARQCRDSASPSGSTAGRPKIYWL